MSEFVGTGPIFAAGEREEEFRGAASAIEDGSLRIPRLEVRIVAGRAAGEVEVLGPERAVVQVQRMPAGQYWAIVENGGEGAFRAEGGEGQPRLRNHQPHDREEPTRPMAEPIRGHLVHEINLVSCSTAKG